MTTAVSPPGSFEGYSLRVWLSRNKGYLKALVSVAFGIVTTFLPQIKDTNLSIAAGSAVSLGLKLALDALDFWLSDVAVAPAPVPDLPVKALSPADVAAAIKRVG